ncbi:MAG: hypothetical protein AAB427_04935, partial [Chloroflexota bacterium]
MVIMLDNYKLPEKGKVDLNVQASFEIKITAEEAQKKVRWWLRDHVGMLLDADPSMLVIGDTIVWRVPVYVSYPHTGRFSNVGVANVDVMTGEIIDPEGAKKAIEEYYEKELRHRIPSYRTRDQRTESKEAFLMPEPNFVALHDKKS